MDYEKILEIISLKSPSILLGIGIFVLFWIFSKIIQLMIKNILSSKNSDTNISRVLSGIIKNIIMIVGFITALGTIGINVSAIVAGLGLTGFAFGFAFKDMLSNFISGILIFIYEPFQLGDTILVDGKGQSYGPNCAGEIVFSDMNDAFDVFISDGASVYPGLVEMHQVLHIQIPN